MLWFWPRRSAPFRPPKLPLTQAVFRCLPYLICGHLRINPLHSNLVERMSVWRAKTISPMCSGQVACSCFGGGRGMQQKFGWREGATKFEGMMDATKFRQGGYQTCV
jgi:hypothetical protein